MKAWKGKSNFLTLLKADTAVTAALPKDELKSLFDETYYTRYVDDVFKRLGLTERQWQSDLIETSGLAPRSI
jgi:adenylosuccinate lyase